MGSKFILYMDNVATARFNPMKKLFAKQARWQDYLAEFDFEIKYRPGRANVIAATLNCKDALVAVISAITVMNGTILDKI